jgi:hypothetical protein
MFDSVDISEVVTELAAGMTNVASLPGAMEYLNALIMAGTTSSREQLFMSSALIVIVSTTEVRLRRIMRRFLEIKGHLFDEAQRRKLLERLFRGGLEKWEDTFRKELGIEIRGWSNEWDRVVEIFARRHTFVHQGGITDAAYRKSTGSKEMIGMPLFLSDAYLNDAIDILTGLTIGALFATWSEARPSVRHPLATVLSQFVHDVLSDGCFHLVEQISTIVEINSIEDYERAQARVNRLLALEGRLGIVAIEDEVGDWNTSELSPLYELARLILGRQDDKARPLFDRLRVAGDLRDSDIATWVIFRRWREDGSIM